MSRANFNPVDRAHELCSILAGDSAQHRGVLAEAKWVVRCLSEAGLYDDAMLLTDAMERYRSAVRAQEEARYALDRVAYAEANLSAQERLQDIANCSVDEATAFAVPSIERLRGILQHCGVSAPLFERELLALGLIAEQRGQFGLASSLLRVRLDVPITVEDRFHSRPVFATVAARVFLELRDFSEALKYSELALHSGFQVVVDDWADRICVHAEILASLGRWTQAERCLAEAIQSLSSERESAQEIIATLEDLLEAVRTHDVRFR